MPESPKIALTGASGFVGTHLKRRFPDHVIIAREDSTERIIKRLDGVDVVINLAGAPIIHRWTDSYKRLLFSSRIETTKKLVSAINQSDVSLFISTSATGIYPDGVECDESCTNLSDDFLGTLAKEWERQAQRCNKKTAILRFGVVLGKEGGALKKMLLPFRLGLGGPIGNGQMLISWIDIEDLLRIYELVIEKGLEGIINAVSPKPVTNKEFTKALSRVLRRPALFPVPVFVLHLLYGQAATVLTASKIVFPKRLEEEGFTFRYGEIEASLRHILSKQQ